MVSFYRSRYRFLHRLPVMRWIAAVKRCLSRRQPARPVGFLLPGLVCISILMEAGPCEPNATVPVPAADRTVWTAADPLSIPHAVRRLQWEKGNLVSNASFESGGTSPDGAVRIDGWQVIGDSVAWLDLAPESAVGHGRRAIRIERSGLGELAGAAGVLSDYIAVIPGNYDLFYDVRIRELAGRRPRMGQRLQDTVVVKVLFFDQNRNPLPPGMINPVSGTEIDASDKSYSFANYWRIDHFPWGTVRGRSYNYPFSEGDIPDRARYVRLFFGLNGNGTLWLDNVVYRYSKWNFSTLERFQPLFHRLPAWRDRILPSPKQFHREEDIVYYRPGISEHPPIIVLPEVPAPAERAAAELLQVHLQRVVKAFAGPAEGPAVQIRRAGTAESLPELFKSEMVFSIGRNRLYDAVQPVLPHESPANHPQGYALISERVGGCPVVFLIGNSPAGSYYAAATAVQLLDPARPVFHSAAVADQPDFSGRCFLLPNWKTKAQVQRAVDRMAWMQFLRFNRAYIGYDRRDRQWYRKSDLFAGGVERVGKEMRAGGIMHLAMMLNPYTQFPFMTAVEELDPDSLAVWDHGSRQSFEMLQQVYRIGLKTGADTIVLLADDFMPHAGKNPYNYVLYSEADRRRFGSLADAHAHLLNQLRHWIDDAYPGTRLEFCPPWYCNEFIDRSEGRAEAYFEALAARIPSSTAIMWTGPTIRSLSVDMADLQRFRKLIGRDPLFWDNTLYARSLETTRYGGYTTYYPGKVRMCNLFEPFDSDRPAGFHRLNDDGSMYVNGALTGEIYEIKYATVADYLWNTAAYDPERSLWKVLCSRYGLDIARRLILFNDAYYTLYGTGRLMELHGADSGLVRRAERQWQVLEAQLRQLSDSLGSAHPLIEELRQRCARQRQRFGNLADNAG